MMKDCKEVKRVRTNSFDPIHSKTVIELKKMVSLFFPYKKIKKKLTTRPDLCDALRQFIEEPKVLLRNDCNSCYIDALMIALFYNLQGSEWLNKVFFTSKVSEDAKGVQSLFKYMYSYLYRPEYNGTIEQNKTLVRDIRNQFEEYEKSRPIANINWTMNQNEPNDVITFLSRMFQIKSDVYVEQTYPDGRKSRNYYDFDYIRIMPYHYYKKRKISLNDVFTEEKYKILDAKFLFVTVNRGVRGTHEMRKSKASVTLPLKIGSLQLVSLILHLGIDYNSGHYVAMVKSNKSDEWYEFDDFNNNYKKVNLQKQKRNIKENVIGAVYT